MKEIESLEQQGLMPRTPQNHLQYIRLKSGSNESTGSFAGSCRQISAYAWNLALGAFYYTGEVVSSVAMASAGLIAVVLCITGDTDNRTMCRQKYENCMKSGGPWTYSNSGGYGRTMCDACRVFCEGQGIWDCPRPQ